MIRLSNIKLSLDHNDQALEQAVLTTLEITPEQLISFNMFRRGYDARKKSNIFLIYTLDVEVSVELEAELLITFADDQLIKQTPDLDYHYVAQAPENLKERPIIVGFGPCGLLAGLTLAQMVLFSKRQFLFPYLILTSIMMALSMGQRFRKVMFYCFILMNKNWNGKKLR